MSFSDMSLMVKFLKLYVPDLSMSKYKSKQGRLRLLQQEENASTTEENSDNNSESESFSIDTND